MQVECWPFGPWINNYVVWCLDCYSLGFNWNHLVNGFCLHSYSYNITSVTSNNISALLFSLITLLGLVFIMQAPFLIMQLQLVNYKYTFNFLAVLRVPERASKVLLVSSKKWPNVTWGWPWELRVPNLWISVINCRQSYHNNSYHNTTQYHNTVTHCTV